MRKTFFLALLIILSLTMLVSCGGVSAEKYSAELFENKKEDMQKIADYLLNDTESSVIMIQKNKNVNSWNSVKEVDGLYWVSNDNVVTFDSSYSDIVSRFLKENRIDQIYVSREEMYVEFVIGSWDVIGHSIVYTKTGEEPKSDPYLWKIKDLSDGWYYAEEKDTSRS